MKHLRPPKFNRVQQLLESGSGPGGRRFKSSLPDQFFQTLELHFWFSVYINGVEIVDGHAFPDFPPGFIENYNPIFLPRTQLSLSSRTSMHSPVTVFVIVLTTDGP